MAVEAGLPRDAIRNVLIGHDPRLSRVEALVDALGLDLYIGPPKEQKESGSLEVSLFQIASKLDSLHSIVENSKDAVLAAPRVLPDPIGVSGARYVELHEMDTAAGGGSMFGEARVKGYVAFQAQWLNRRGLVASQCAVIGVKGESMEPTLPDGCSILSRARQAASESRAHIRNRDKWRPHCETRASGQEEPLGAGKRPPGLGSAAVAGGRPSRGRSRVDGSEFCVVAELGHILRISRLASDSLPIRKILRY